MEDLFIFDLANNHQGDIEHALNIINQIGEIVKKHNVKAAFKFQLRNIETFIHPDYKDKKDVKHIPRFISTALSFEDYKKLTKAVSDNGMITMSTPFDEESVDMIQKLGIDIIKVASCSAKDWPLLEKISDVNKPTIVSTAGLSISNIDRLVSFLQLKISNFAIMHCVAIYPTPAEKLSLNQIENLIGRYPGIPIGFSTHEEPYNIDYIKIAFSKGAKLFERHVGLNTDKYKLNAYSSTPDQINKWINAYKDAKIACGGERRSPISHEELASLKSLMRGVYAKKEIKKGQVIQQSDIFFAMPLQENQLTSGEWIKGIKADKDYKINEKINDFIANIKITKEEQIFQIMLQVMGMLRNARITIGSDSSIELSHHYGLDRFREFGATIIDCINRTYCKKIIVLLPRQKHPYHYHKIKEETFQVLHGEMEIEKNGKITKLTPGDLFLVEAGAWHKFHTLDGIIFEEVSTTHINDDSYYEDERIAKLKREDRKTNIPNWESLQKKIIKHQIQSLEV